MSDSESASEQKTYKASLFVRNLPDNIEIEDLKDLCKKYADVKDVYIPTDYYSKKRKGFAFIEFYTKKEALKVLDKIGGKEVKGNRLSVMLAKQGRKSAVEMKTKEKKSKRYSKDRSRSESSDRHRHRKNKKHKRSYSKSESESRSRSRSRRRRREKKRSRSSSKNRSRSDSKRRTKNNNKKKDLSSSESKENVGNSLKNDLSARSASSKSGEVNKVIIDSLVLMKIIKHSKSPVNKLATGQLHGIYYYDKAVLEITNSYPIPNKEGDTTEADNYDANMMAKFETVNLDNNKVGWYQVSYSKDHLYYASFETHFEYQKSHPYAVFLVYDVLQAEKGGNYPFKIFRINEAFFEILKNKEIPVERVKKLNVKYDKFFIEVPYEIQYSPLTKAFFADKKIFLKSPVEQQEVKKNVFAGFLTKNIEGLNESIDELNDLVWKLNEEFMKPAQKSSKKVEKKNYEAESFMDHMITLKRLGDFAEEAENVGDLLADSALLMKELNKVLP